MVSGDTYTGGTSIAEAHSPGFNLVSLVAPSTGIPLEGEVFDDVEA